MVSDTWGKVEEWAIPEKNRRGLMIYFFELPLEFLGFLLYLWKYEIKIFNSRNSKNFVVTSLGNFWGLKPIPLEIQHYFLLITSGSSTLSLITPPLPCLFSSGIAQRKNDLIPHYRSGHYCTYSLLTGSRRHQLLLLPPGHSIDPLI